MTTNIALTRKITGIYVAYAPRFELSAYGSCRDEALNNLSDEIRQLEKDATGEERS